MYRMSVDTPKSKRNGSLLRELSDIGIVDAAITESLASLELNGSPAVTRIEVGPIYLNSTEIYLTLSGGQKFVVYLRREGT